MPDPGESRGKLDVLRRHCDGVRHDYDEIEKTALIEVDLRAGRMRARDVVERIRAHAAEGMEHVIVKMPDVYELEHLEAFGRVRECRHRLTDGFHCSRGWAAWVAERDQADSRLLLVSCGRIQWLSAAPRNPAHRVGNGAAGMPGRTIDDMTTAGGFTIGSWKTQSDRRTQVWPTTISKLFQE